jgi:hypothetical protein
MLVDGPACERHQASYLAPKTHGSDTHPIDPLAIARARLAAVVAERSFSHEHTADLELVLARLDELEAAADPPTTPGTPSAKRGSERP